MSGDTRADPGGGAEAPTPARIGRYELIRRVGAGATGVVYAARARDQGELVALKALHKLDPRALFRLKNEFRSVADLHHPNLVALHELVSEGDQWFITMEYIEGVDFTAYVRGAPARLAERARLALRQLTAGLLALHAARRLHRDIKSANVLITPDDRLVLLDFGLTGDDNNDEIDATLEGDLVGTPAYMSPEQAAGSPATTASDWYAVGVMLYEALSGRLPFVGPPLRVLAAKQHEDPPPLDPHTPGVTPDLIEICRGLLQRRPERRLGGDQLLLLLSDDAAGALDREDPRPVPTSRRIIGREEQLAALDAAFIAAAAAPILLDLHGPAGIGKSALVDHFLASITASGAGLALSGRCYERESVPYKAFDHLLDALSNHLRGLSDADAAALLPRDIHALARVFPVLDRVAVIRESARRSFTAPDPQELRRRAFRGLRELLARIADRHRLVLVLGDIQWGDEDSARLLQGLLAPPDPPALLVIGVYRSDEAVSSPMLNELRRLLQQPELRIDRRELALGPLSHAESQRLALHLLGQRGDPADAEAIARESAGSPLFIEELVWQLQSADHPASTPRISLDAVVRARARHLSPGARRLLDLLAIAGRPLPRNLALRAAEIGEGAHAAIAQLTAAHLIRGRGRADDASLECAHERLRAAIIAALPTEARQAQHRTLAAVMLAGGWDEPEELAQHYFAADERERAAYFAALAAERAAAALAFNRAAELYRLSRAWLPRLGAAAQDLLIRHADALTRSGRCSEAAPLYLQAAETAAAPLAIELRRRAAEQLLVSGSTDHGLKILRPLLASVGLSLPSTSQRAALAIAARTAHLRLRGAAFAARSAADCDPRDLQQIDVCWSASRCLCFLDPAGGHALALKGLLLALNLGEPTRVARGLATVGMMMLAERGERSVVRGANLLREAEAIAERLADSYLIGLVHTIDGLGQISLGRWHAALTRIDRGDQLLHDHGAGIAWESSVAQRGTMRALLALGRLRELRARAQAWRREAEDAGDRHGEIWAILFWSYAQLTAGDPRGARDSARAAIERWTDEGFHFQHLLALAVEVYADLYEDRPLAAWTRLSRAWPAIERSRLLGWSSLAIFAVQLRSSAALAAASASPGHARELLQIAEEAADALRDHSVERSDGRATASAIRACVAAINGNRRRALDHLSDALAAYEAAEMSVHAACVRRRRGECSDDRAEIAAADAIMRREGVADPRKLARIFLPGFADEPV
jgi:hypothetical protein